MDNAIPEIFFETAKKFPEKTALLYKKEGVYFPITYRELSEKITRLSVGLKDLGLKKGDKVAIFSENRPEWVVADLAIMASGGVVVPIHTTLSPQTIGKILTHCQATIAIISNGTLFNKLLLNQKKLKRLQHIIALDQSALRGRKILGNKMISWRKAFSRKKNVTQGAISLNPSDCCTIIYTSGTTADPKGVMLTHHNFLSNISAIQKAVPVKESDVFLSFLPLSHVLERTGGYYMPLLFGATIAYAENPKELPNNIKEVIPTVLVAVPRIFEKMHDRIWDKVNASSPLKKKLFLWALKQKKGTFFYTIADKMVFKAIRKQLGGRLRLTISGGASLSENLCRFFSKIGVVILEGYGLTETSPVVSVNQEAYVKFGTVGKMVEGVEIRISAEKEILVKGPNVFSGYFKNKKESKSCFNQEGFFNTGDLGFIDQEGFLTIIGRKKDMFILSGGKNIWPEQIENILNNDKFISQSMVVGSHQKFVAALIVPDWQEVELFLKKNALPMQSYEKLLKNPVIQSLFQKRIEEKINPQLSDFEKIKKFKLLSTEFSQANDELTPTLKLRRHAISHHHKKSIESIYL